MTDEPDWDLLRDDPRAFFGLDEGPFDRKDLKRAYNRWLRRYKPERAPKEFQQLRAAYEALDEELRYGVEVTRRPVPEDVPAELEPVEVFDAAGALRARSAAELLADLDRRADLSPRLFVRRAILAEELAEDDPLTLVRCLADGARATNGHELIASWLHEACRDPLSPDDAREVIRTLSTLVDDASHGSELTAAWFDRATEPLWTRVVEESDFEDFRALFEATSHRRRDESGLAHVVLLFRVVRRGLFHADPDWVQEQFAEIEHAYHELPPWYQHELDVFFWLARYLDVRESFLNGDPSREAVDRCVRAILEGDVRKADRECFRLFAFVRESRDALFDALPAGTDFELVVMPILWYADQLEERHVRSVEAGDARLIAGRVHAFAQREEQVLDKGWERWTIGYLNLLRYVLWFVAGAGVVGLAWFAASNLLGIVLVAAAVVLAAIFRRACYRFLANRVDMWLIYPQRVLALRLYRKRLRPALERFFASARLDFSAVVDELEREDVEAGLARNILSGQAPGDAALALSSLSHQFVE